jgi:hypothetical protein
MIGSAAAGPSPVAMSIATHGSAIDLTFTNQTKQRLTLTTHVRATHDNFDWLTVKLTSNGTTRTLRFEEDRKKAIPVDAELDPGKSVTVSADLVTWSMYAGNGAPLRAGTYDVEATWDMSKETKGPVFSATAKTKLVVAAAKDVSACAAKQTTAGLELLVSHADKDTIEFGVHNIDTEPHCIEAYIKTHELQSDQLSFEVPLADKSKRVVTFTDARDKSFPIYNDLVPGATTWTTWKLPDWVARHDKHALPKTPTIATAIYDATHVTGAWHGVLSTTFVFP